MELEGGALRGERPGAALPRAGARGPAPLSIGQPGRPGPPRRLRTALRAAPATPARRSGPQRRRWAVPAPPGPGARRPPPRGRPPGAVVVPCPDLARPHAGRPTPADGDAPLGPGTEPPGRGVPRRPQPELARPARRIAGPAGPGRAGG